MARENPSDRFHNLMCEVWSELHDAYLKAESATGVYQSFSSREEHSENLRRLMCLISEAQELTEDIKREAS